MNPVHTLKENPFILAPMAGITDHPFRSYMRKLGAGVVITELVSATGLEYKSQRTQSLMSFDEGQRPVAVQLFGEDPQHMAKAAQQVEQMGADFVDVNFGCPVPKVVKKGAGSAMLKDLPAMKILLTAMVSAVKIPVTIKIRTGWDGGTRNALDVVNLASDVGIAWVAIHGRTRAQGYDGSADWDFIGEVKAKAKIPIIGNGDVVTAAQAVSRLQQYGVDGVMIGRGALKNPLIFKQALSLLKNNKTDFSSQPTLPDLFLGLKDTLVAHCDDRITQIQLKKFAAWYATGYAGAAQFRRNIFQAQSTDEVMSEALGFLKTINNIHREDQDNQGFLMGGHG